jgi:hypothetical protein
LIATAYDMATRKFILNLGQSNGGTQADYATWQAAHANLAVDFALLSSSFARGPYTDTLTLPTTFPTPWQTVSLKGAAVSSLRYLTFYSPVATGLGYLTYPHTARIASVIAHDTTSTSLELDKWWQYDPTGRTIVREKTGAVHTISVWAGGSGVGDQIAVTPAFDPPPEEEEQITYSIYAGANSPNTTTLLLDMRYGGDFGVGNWDGSLAGCRIRCTAGTANNVNISRYIDDIILDTGITPDIPLAPTIKITVTAAWPATPQDGDQFVIEPPPVGAISVPFKQWGYFLPWSPIEGRALGTSANITAASEPVLGQVLLTVANTVAVGDMINVAGTTDYNGNHLVLARTASNVTIAETYTSSQTGTMRPWQRNNPYPPGFNYPTHYDTPILYQPFTGPSIAYGVAAAYTSARCAYHIGLANRMQETLGEDLYVVSLIVDGTTIQHYDITTNDDFAVGWYDPQQHTSWAPAEANNIYGRLVDTLQAASWAAQRQGDTLECEGVFFIQGEGDASFLDAATRYADNLRTLKTKVREAIVAAGLYSGTAATIPWIHPQISGTSMVSPPPWPYLATVNAAIVAEAEADRYMRTFAMTDATKISGDEAHYDVVGLYLLEDRAFTAWQEIADSVGPAGYEDEMVVEDGTGLSTANSYCTHAFADTYFANQGGVAVWTSATSIARDTALRQATAWIDLAYGTRFAGYKLTSTQLLEFPRGLAYDRDGEAITGVPLTLKRAVCEAAKRMISDSTQFFPDEDAGSNVNSSSVTVGPITVSDSFAGTQSTARKFPIIDRLLGLGSLVDYSRWAGR